MAELQMSIYQLARFRRRIEVFPELRGEREHADKYPIRKHKSRQICRVRVAGGNGVVQKSEGNRQSLIL